MKNPFRSRHSLILSGIFVGILLSNLFPNPLITSDPLINSLFSMLLICFSFIICLKSWLDATWENGRKVSGIRKLRLIFFGVSMASFAMAIYDVICFYGSGISFASMLISFAIGGFFTVAERFLELYENGDI